MVFEKTQVKQIYFFIEKLFVPQFKKYPSVFDDRPWADVVLQSRRIFELGARLDKRVEVSDETGLAISSLLSYLLSSLNQYLLWIEEKEETLPREEEERIDSDMKRIIQLIIEIYVAGLPKKKKENQ